MNIFLLSQGLSEYSLQLAKGLCYRDHLVIALEAMETNRIERELPDFFTNTQLKTIELPHFSFPDIRKIRQALRTYRKIIQHKTDVIHVQTTCIYAEALLTLWLAKISGKTLVATLHDTKVHPGDTSKIKWHSAWLNFSTLELCSQIIVHGQRMADDLVNMYGFDRQRIHIIPHGNYDIYLHARRASSDITPNLQQVLLFGRMRRYKGLNILIKAAALVKNKVPNLKIVLAGSGPELDRLEPQLQSNPMFEIHNRKIPSDEVAELFFKSNLIVLPYIEASQSGPLHLAYTCGRSVVAANVGAISESLTDGCEGFLVPPNEPHALADAMIKILNNPELAYRFGQAGRIKADTTLNWEGDIAEKTRTVYQKATIMKKKGYSFINFGKRWQRIKTNYYRETDNDCER